MKNHRLKNYLKIGMILVGISMFLWNCQKEDIANPLSLYQQNKEIQSIQQKFTLENYQDSFIKNNLKVDWNNFVYSNNMNVKVIKSNLDNPNNNLVDDNFVTYEFGTNLNSKVSSIKDTTYFYSKKSLLASIDKRNNSITLKIINYSSYINNDLEHINLNSLKNFIGTITLFDLKGKSLKVDAYNSGELVESFKIPNNDKNLGHMAPPIGGTLIPVFIEHWRDIYQNLGGGSTYFYYINSHYEGTTVEYVYANTGFTSYGTYHGHFDDPHGPPNHPDNHPDEIIIDSLDTCSKNIFDLLQSNLSIRAIINQFAGENSQFSWTLETADESNFENTSNSAETTWLNGTANNYVTSIGTNYSSSATKLSIARTIVHEAIHAYILSYLDSGIDTFTSEFPDLWNDLVSRKYGDPNTPSGWNLYHHQEIARNYVNTIADALADWDHHQNSNQYYNDLAWGGLLNTQIFQETTDLTENDRLRISNINNAEDLNTTDAKSNPCN